MICSRIPAHCRAFWTVWRRGRPSVWHLAGAYCGPPTAYEAAEKLSGETLVLPPGKALMMRKGLCHGRHP